MRHWEDKGARRKWRWVLLVYSLAASALTIYGSFADVRILGLAGFFLASSAFLFFPRRTDKGWLAVAVLMISTPTIYTFLSTTVVNDMAAGRQAIQIEILMVPIYRTVHESEVTSYYREYVSEELPLPKWYEDSTDIILFFPVHLDRFGPSLDIAGRAFKQTFDRYKPPEDIKAHIIQTFFKINSRVGPSFISAITYAKAISALFDEKKGKVTLDDLANADKLIAQERQRIMSGK